MESNSIFIYFICIKSISLCLLYTLSYMKDYLLKQIETVLSKSDHKATFSQEKIIAYE